MKITTIGGGNWQSNLLDSFYEKFEDKIELSSIVSMSDDWRTTWELMKAFKKELNLHLPPPWDLRRCLFSLSTSKYKAYFKLIFEHIFLVENEIHKFSIKELFDQVHKELIFLWKSWNYKNDLENYDNSELKKYLDKNCNEIYNFKLNLKTKLNWHKFGNILMASLYYNFKDYDKMLDFMHNLLKVKWKVLPVTTKKAYIKAILGNWEIIETQDRISNIADYTSWIADLELMEDSKDKSHNKKVCDAIIESDFIIIWPWDLYTSIISNFIIWWVQESIKKSNAKIIYIWNSTNKWWETNWLTQLDFVNKIERFLGRRLDYFIANNQKPKLGKKDFEKFKKDISIKWWDYLFVSKGEKKELERRKVKLIEAPLISKESFYKHDKKKILDILEKIFCEKDK